MLPQWGLGRSLSRQRLWCVFSVKERCLVAFKMQHGLKHQKTAFLYLSQIIVKVQAIEDTHNQIIVRVRTYGPSRDRRL